MNGQMLMQKCEKRRIMDEKSGFTIHKQLTTNQEMRVKDNLPKKGGF